MVQTNSVRISVIIESIFYVSGEINEDTKGNLCF